MTIFREHSELIVKVEQLEEQVVKLRRLVAELGVYLPRACGGLTCPSDECAHRQRLAKRVEEVTS